MSDKYYEDYSPEYYKKFYNKNGELNNIDLYDTPYFYSCYKDACGGKFVYFEFKDSHNKKYHNNKCCNIL